MEDAAQRERPSRERTGAGRPVPRPAATSARTPRRVDGRGYAILFLGSAAGAAVVTALFHLVTGGERPVPTPTPTPIAATPSPTATRALVVTTAETVAVEKTEEPVDLSRPFQVRPGEEAVGILSISSEPVRSQVYVDGTFISDAPALIPDVPAPRRYVVELRHEGHSTWSREIDVVDDQAVQVVAKLVPLDIPGKLRVAVPLGGSAYVDGKLVGHGPTVATVDAYEGKHQLRMKDANGMILREYEVLVAKGRVTEIALPPP